MIINFGVAAYLCSLMVVLGLVCVIGTMLQASKQANGSGSPGGIDTAGSK